MIDYELSSITESSVKIKVTGLSSDETYNIRFFVRLADDKDDTTYDDTVEVSGRTYYNKSISRLDEDTDYIVNVGIDTGSGNSWLGATEFTTEEAGSDKPSTFSWTNAKTKGKPFNLTAVEWNNFTLRINEMREYLGLSDYSFTKAVKGNVFTAGMYNEARKAIQGMGDDVGSYIPTVSSGQTITAYMMNQIVAELNSAITNL